MARKTTKAKTANGSAHADPWSGEPPVSQLELAVCAWLAALGAVRKAQGRVEKLLEDQNIDDFDRRVQAGFERRGLARPVGGKRAVAGVA